MSLVDAEDTDEQDGSTNWATNRSFGPRPVTALGPVKEGPKVKSLEEALRQQLATVMGANKELKVVAEKARNSSSDSKASDAKTKKIESQLKQARRDIQTLEEQLKGKGKDSDDDDELDFYKKITEKKDQQISALKSKMESNEDLVATRKDLEEMTGAKERMEARVVKLKEQKTKLKRAHADLKKESTKLKEQLQEAYELQEELEARAGGGGGVGGSDTVVLKLEFEIKQLKKDLAEAEKGGGADVAKLEAELALERAKPRGGVSKEDHADLEEENADLTSELDKTKKALAAAAGGSGGGGGANSGDLEELREVKKEQTIKIKQLEREVEDLNKEAREKQREFREKLEAGATGGGGGSASEVRERDEMIEKLNEQIAEITELAGIDPEELRDAEAARDAAQKKAEMLQETIERLEKDSAGSRALAEAEADRDKAQARLQGREDELKAIRSELDAATDKELQLRADLREAKRELMEMMEKSGASNASGGGAVDAEALETAKAAERELKRRVMELETEQGSVERDARRHERDATRSKERLEVVEKELEECEKVRRDLERENRRMKREMDDAA